jgi:hypothetical protein
MYRINHFWIFDAYTPNVRRTGCLTIIYVIKYANEGISKTKYMYKVN